MEDTEKIKSLLKERLSKKRYNHSINVADEARRLAERWDADPQKAYYAGLVHDICKELTPKEQLEMVMHSDMDVCEEEAKVSQLWHAVAGAYYVQNVLGETDAEILGAVRYHTAAHKGMTRLEEVVYLADLISADRTYKSVDKMRKIAYQDISAAMLEALVFSVADVAHKHSFIPRSTFEAYNYYISRN